MRHRRSVPGGPEEPGHAPSHQRTDARRDVRRAWLSLALLPFAFLLAVFVGDLLLALHGYADGDVEIPLPVALRAGGPALIVLSAPGVAAVVFGVRAWRRGARGGLAPAVIGGIAVIGAITLNTAALLVGR